MYLTIIIILIIIASLSSTSTSNPLWTRSSFPNPEIDPTICRCVDSSLSNRICDPDIILSTSELQSIAKSIEKLERDHIISSSSCRGKKKDDDDDGVHVQLGVAIVRQMALGPFLQHGIDAEMKAAQSTARGIHDDWGIGYTTNNKNNCGGSNNNGSTGILLFLSLYDRAMYISTGKAIQQLLTDSRLDQTMEIMKLPLRRGQYAIAITDAIKQINEYLILGPPSRMERLVSSFVDEYIHIFLFILVVLILFLKGQWDERRIREYTRVESELSQLDRERAQALLGQYHCTTCPICLEPFGYGNDDDNDDNDDPSSSDTKKKDDDDDDNSEPNEKKEKKDRIPKVGSDGLPIRLLRCGHAFDETCWQDWISTGRSNVHKCPICKQDVAGGGRGRGEQNRMSSMAQSPSFTTTSTASPSSSTTTTTTMEDTTTTTSSTSPQLQHRTTNSRSSSSSNNNNNLQQWRERNIADYELQRAFRLARLSNMYPRYIRPQQVQIWSNRGYNGSLVRDPGFIQNNPRMMESSSGSSGMRNRSFRSGSGSGFGGGASAGGRGGRW